MRGDGPLQSAQTPMSASVMAAPTKYVLLRGTPRVSTAKSAGRTCVCVRVHGCVCVWVWVCVHVWYVY